jgi:hypothetical protein
MPHGYTRPCLGGHVRWLLLHASDSARLPARARAHAEQQTRPRRAHLSRNGGKLDFSARYLISVLLSPSNSVHPISRPRLDSSFLFEPFAYVFFAMMLWFLEFMNMDDDLICTCRIGEPVSVSNLFSNSILTSTPAYLCDM